MQQSLEAYFHTLFADLLGGAGGGQSGNGGCFPGFIANCKPGDVEAGRDTCWGKGEATCSKGASVRCQDTKTLNRYNVTTDCWWISSYKP